MRYWVFLLVLSVACRETVEGSISLVGDEGAGDAAGSGDAGPGDGAGDGAGDGNDLCPFECAPLVCDPDSHECVECLVPEHCDLPESFDDECAIPTCVQQTCGSTLLGASGSCTPDDHPEETGTCQGGACVWCTDPTDTVELCDAALVECGEIADNCGALRSCGDCGVREVCQSGTCACIHLDCNGCCVVGQVCDGISGECCERTVDCAEFECGADGCNNVCGLCDADNEICDSGHCRCAFDACAGICCSAGQVCDTEGACCTQTNSCTGRDCGTDGCGNSCGSCGSLMTCNTGDGQCVCTHEECDGSCCASGQICHNVTDTCCDEDTRTGTQVCNDVNANCGTVLDDCGHARECGPCSGNDYCDANVCTDHDASSTTCSHTSSYVWVASGAGSAWSNPDPDTNCCRDDPGEHHGNYSYAADDNWTVARSNTTIQACCGTFSECVGGTTVAPECVGGGDIDPQWDERLCVFGVMFLCGDDSVCRWRPEYTGMICKYDGDTYFWDAKSESATADIGTFHRQKITLHDDKYVPGDNSWGTPVGSTELLDLWACCDDVDDCVVEDASTASDLGGCVNSPANGGTQWLCGDGGLWYECRPDSNGATMAGHTCSDGSGIWIWEE